MRIGIFLERGQRLQHQTGTFVQRETEQPVEASPADEILLHELRLRYDLQKHENELLDLKAGIILAYLGAVASIAGDDILEQLQGLGQGWPGSVMDVLSLVAVLSFLGAVMSALLIIVPGLGYAPVGIEAAEVEAYLADSRSAMLLQIMSQYSHTIQANMPSISTKARLARLALSLSSFSTIYLFVFLK